MILLGFTTKKSYLGVFGLLFWSGLLAAGVSAAVRGLGKATRGGLCICGFLRIIKGGPQKKEIRILSLRTSPLWYCLEGLCVWV